MPTDFESWWLETGEQLTKHEVGLKDLMQCAYEARRKAEPVLWERMSKRHTAGRWVPCADKTEATGALMGGWEIRPLFTVPQPVGPFNSDTVVCRRYTQAHYPGQTFFHYDLEAIFDSVPVKLGDLLKMVGLQKWE